MRRTLLACVVWLALAANAGASYLGPLPQGVTAGGTGASSFTANDLICANTTSTGALTICSILKSNVATTNTQQSFTAGKAVTPSALTFSATITPNLSTSSNFTVTLTGNATIANPSSILAGECGWIAVTQDATGSRTLAWGSDWKWPGGTAPTLTTTASASDLISYCAISSSIIAAQLALANYH